jgi:hypothetical protein
MDLHFGYHGALLNPQRSMMSLRCGSLQTAKPVNRSTRCWDIIAKLAAGQYTACVIPGAKLSVYEGIGFPVLPGRAAHQR